MLDLSRLVSRVGRGPATGIDRVEIAYLQELLDQGDRAVFALVRASPGFALLDRRGMAELAARLRGAAEWGRPDWLSRLHLRQRPLRRRVMSDLRRLALGWSIAGGLARLLRRHLPPGTLWLNTGHTNLSPRVAAALRGVSESRVAAMVHDVIPLDHPEFTRPGVPAAFEARLKVVADAADLVIYNSGASMSAATPHLARLGRVPPCVVAHLGVDAVQPDRAALARHWPAQLALDRPYFVILGTIEPRKNHMLLLELWADFARELPDEHIPALCILGARGWNNAEVFARLDHDPNMGRHIFELPGLPDAAVAAALQGALGLLFPSHVEGFGLPLLEAKRLNVATVCSDLSVFREIVGDYPVYVATDAPYLWRQSILELAQRQPAGHDAQRRDLPGWPDHFETVWRAVRDMDYWPGHEPGQGR